MPVALDNLLSRKDWLILVAVCCAIILAVVAWRIVDWWIIAPGLDNALDNKYNLTQARLNKLQMLITCWAHETRTVPGPGMPEALKAAKEVLTNRTQPEGELRETLEGLDAWGRPLVYEKLREHFAVIRSVGPNGIDENGLGDDIEREIDIAWSN